MQIFHHVDEYKHHNGSVVTLGTFDGVHRGHHQLINQLNKIAAASNCAGVVLTFHPHPRMVIFPDDHGLQLLNTLEEKIEIFRQFGIQHLIIQPFTLEFSRLDAVPYFVRDLLVQKLKVQKLIIGHDHHFGRNRQGNLTELEELAPIYNFDVLEVEGYEPADPDRVGAGAQPARLADGERQRARAPARAARRPRHVAAHALAAGSARRTGDRRPRRAGWPGAWLRAGAGLHATTGR